MWAPMSLHDNGHLVSLQQMPGPSTQLLASVTHLQNPVLPGVYTFMSESLLIRDPACQELFPAMFDCTGHAILNRLHNPTIQL